MSDPQEAHGDGRSSSDETPMIPDELVPRQESEDPVADGDDTSGNADESVASATRSAADQDDENIDLNDLA